MKRSSSSDWDLFTVALKQIGSCIGKAQLEDAVNVLIHGDGNDNAAEKVSLSSGDSLTYQDLLNLWGSFGEYQMNVMLASPDMMLKILQVPELQNPETGLNFQATGCLSTPPGRKAVCFLRSSGRNHHRSGQALCTGNGDCRRH